MSNVLQLCAGLTPAVLDSIADLQRRTTSVDGGRLKLEWGVLNARCGDRVEDLLWWDGDTLLGFLGLYSFGGADMELTGMVDPRVRRRGIATALIDAAVPLILERGHREVLLVCPRQPDAGRAFARSRGAAPDHSEYSLLLHDEPVATAVDPTTLLRAALPTDSARVQDLLDQGFGLSSPGLQTAHGSDHLQHLVVERDGHILGYLRLTHLAGQGGVYGFVIAEGLRGKGIGRDVLHRACTMLRAQGAATIRLEVAVDNEHALRLYTTLGFTPTTTEDYFRLAIAPTIDQP